MSGRLSPLWYSKSCMFSSVQLLSCVRLFATPWIATCQPSLSITNSQSSLKFMSIKSVMPSSHLILCRPLLLLPPIPPSVRVFSNKSALRMRWPKSWSVSVTQSCPPLCDPMDCSPPGSSVHGILQARILEWVAIPFSRGSSWTRDWTWVSFIAGRFFTTCTTITFRSLPFWVNFLSSKDPVSFFCN